MLNHLIKQEFIKHGGKIVTHSLTATNKIVFKLTEDRKGFFTDKGGAVYRFDKIDAIEKELLLVAAKNNGKVYFGDNLSRSGQRVGDDFYDSTIDGIVARVGFGKESGDSAFGGSTYIAALFAKVGYATINSTDHIGRFIYIIGYELKLKELGL